MKKLHCVICNKYRKFEKLKISYLLGKHQFFLLFALSVKMKMKKKIKDEESNEMLKNLGLINNIEEYQKI